ncbi:hypothetical protein N7510_000010 [Penicillium lagena]|uniref:uncharacterized protein n=1 Tax=Penicillium lagena TaxID=94218 RepID=UPI002540C6B2|nr:uncharacterized protein N7510_011835 [Penicillium lagena]XP_056837057.1 uncharacterized protein N7510_000010 [Penicillium lagena]KAJ5598885.1 hypothetical protein N7510_011835 [Penicillium lagena]KAJ5623701.1 hypothetical protein N7510_000010 [Penicillium lagena]
MLTSQFAVYPTLRKRIVIISGGATGIGGAMVEAFANQGAQVVILDILTKAACQLIEKLEKAGVTYPPIFMHCDVTDIEGDVKSVSASLLELYPQIDVLINNAANDKRQKSGDITLDLWEKGLATNLRHHFFITQALLPAFSETSSVINMGSVAWATPLTDMAPYVVSKSAIVGLTKTLAHELGLRGIRVNSIMPGAIATERQKRDIITPEYEKSLLERQALKRILKPSDVSNLALWLSAADGSGMTGQSIVIDGGWL